MQTINKLRIETTAFALIDHQPFVAFPVRSIAAEQLTNNVVGLAKVALALGIPTVLTTVAAEGGPMRDPLFAELAELFPNQTPIDRHNTNAWSDQRFVDAVTVTATGCRQLVMAGLWIEVCLAQTALSAIDAGYEVYVVADASGGVSDEAHQLGMERMVQAGARPITWQAVMAELCPDSTSAEYQRLYPVVARHGQGVSYAVQYVLANLSAS